MNVLLEVRDLQVSINDNKILNISEKVDIVKKFGADFFIKQIFNNISKFREAIRYI